MASLLKEKYSRGHISMCFEGQKNNGISVNQTKDEFSLDESKSMKLPLIAVFMAL